MIEHSHWKASATPEKVALFIVVALLVTGFVFYWAGRWTERRIQERKEMEVDK